MKLKTLTVTLVDQDRQVWRGDCQVDDAGQVHVTGVLLTPYRRTGLVPDPMDKRANEVCQEVVAIITAIAGTTEKPAGAPKLEVVGRSS